MEQHVIASSGTFLEEGGINLEYTIGETCVSRHESQDNLQLTEGFHQINTSFCFGDFNNDQEVNTSDLLIFLGNFGSPCICLPDLNGDGEVDTSDLLLFLSAFGSNCPNP
jgi:hypothetical protein